MQTALSSTLPSEKQVQKLVRDVSVVHDGIVRYVVNLTPTEKRRSPKPRPGAEKIADMLARIAADLKLMFNGASPDDIVANRARAERLRPLQEASVLLARELTDAVFAAESKAWTATTDLYTVLKRLSRRDAALKAQIEPATDFFATGKRKAKVSPPPPAK